MAETMFKRAYVGEIQGRVLGGKWSKIRGPYAIVLLLDTKFGCSRGSGMAAVIVPRRAGYRCRSGVYRGLCGMLWLHYILPTYPCRQAIWRRFSLTPFRRNPYYGRSSLLASFCRV